MIEITKPTTLAADDFYNIMIGIDNDAFNGIERRDKGKQNDRYIALWDETIATVPTDAEKIGRASGRERV